MISVIIPVYNTARWLPQCLDSVLGQDHVHIEVILVNDASTDNSLQVCRRYAEQDARIKLVDKPRNEGLELARYSGFAVATGDYVFHLDSDDWLDNPQVFSKMYAKAEETGADYVDIGRLRVLDRYKLLRRPRTKTHIVGLVERPELFEKYYLSYFGITLLWTNICGKLYRKSTIDKAQIEPLGLYMGEDLAFNIRLFPFLQKIFILEETGYVYRYGGMTNKYNQYLLPDLKRIHRLKEELIKKYDYKAAVNSVQFELKNTLRTDISQQIALGDYTREEVLARIASEMKDPIYDKIKTMERSSAIWEDPFTTALAAEDAEVMYDICRSQADREFAKKRLVRFIAYLIGKMGL